MFLGKWSMRGCKQLAAGQLSWVGFFRGITHCRFTVLVLFSSFHSLAKACSLIHQSSRLGNKEGLVWSFLVCESLESAGEDERVEPSCRVQWANTIKSGIYIVYVRFKTVGKVRLFLVRLFISKSLTVRSKSSCEYTHCPVIEVHNSGHRWWGVSCR